mmetsp:Transcript_12406/g.15059  ORF Transcript_12406/g.15059 Transcript_12406/m.15059 type:complete len:437 (-) Transcript_12406:155-1465(-)
MGKVTVFVDRLWTLVHSVEFETGAWTGDGSEFEVFHKKSFEEAISENFTCSLKTFKRQLYFYGFQTSDYRGKTWKFSHPNFKRNCPHLLERVKRQQIVSSTQVGKKRKLQLLASPGGKITDSSVSFKPSRPGERRKARTMIMIEDIKEKLSQSLDDLKRNICETLPSGSSCPSSLEEFDKLLLPLHDPDDSSCLETRMLVDDDEELEINMSCLSEAPLITIPLSHPQNIYVRIYNKRLNFGEKLTALFFNRFVAVAEKFQGYDDEALLGHLSPGNLSVHEEYSLVRLKHYLNPLVAAILSSTIEADKNVHKDVIQCAHASEFSKPDSEILFEYHFIGGIFAVYMEHCATFLTNIVHAVHDTSGISMRMGYRPACAIYQMMEPYLTKKAKQYIAASSFYYSPKEMERLKKIQTQIGKLNRSVCNGHQSETSAITIFS